MRRTSIVDGASAQRCASRAATRRACAQRWRVSGRLTSGGPARARRGTRALGQLAPRPRRASLTAIHHAAPTHAAIDGDRTTAPRTEDVRHGALPLPTVLASVNVERLRDSRLRSPHARARVHVMDPLTLDARRGGARRVRLSAADRPLPRRAARAPARARLRSRRYRTLPDARVRYWRGGRGAPLVFVHGFGTEAAVNWYAQLLAFAPTFDVVAPDLPGLRRVGSLADDELHRAAGPLPARRCSTTSGSTRVALVGHSMGGWISLAFAAAYPERVERLVVVDAAGLRFDPDLTLERALLPRTHRRRPPADPRQLPAAAAPAGASCCAICLRVAQRDAVPRTELLQRLVYGDEHLDDRLAAIAAPTLVVWGRGRPADAARARRAHRRGDSAAPSSVVFEDCAHSPNVEQPERFNASLLRVPRAARASRVDGADARAPRSADRRRRRRSRPRFSRSRAALRA